MTIGLAAHPLPNGWAETPLIDIVSHRSGNSKLIKGKLHSAPGPQLVPAYSASGQDVWCEDAEHDGDAVIVSAVGARCGKAFKASGHWSAIANTHIVWPDQGTLLNSFLWYLINNEDFWIKSGTAQPFVKVRHSFERTIGLPPVPEQARIVQAIESYFTRLDDAVATLERVQRNLNRYRASVLKAAVEGRLVTTEAELARAEGRDYEPASVLLERILAERRRRWEEAELAKMKAKGKAPKNDKWKAKYTVPVAPDADDLPELPEGWCWARTEQCVYSQVGHAFKSGDFIEDGVRLLRGDNIGHGELRWDRARRKCIHSDALSMHPHLHLAADDIVLAMDRPLISTGLKIANVRSTDLPALLVQRVIRLRPAVHRDYFLLNLHSEPFMRHLSTEAKGGGVPHVSEGQIKDYCFPLPPLAEQERISLEVERLVSNALDSIAVVDVSVRRCSRLRQSTLKWAFEGRLVDQDPSDEPAARLLERIQVERESANGQPRRSPRRPRARSPKA
jgi:type I restriction enzyme S subunit